MNILINKKTKDADLKIGMQVCYCDISGAYSKLGVITDTYKDKGGFIEYIINTSFGSYLASELKLIEKPVNKSVKVIFEDESDNYTTSVSATATDEGLKRYFINQRFNVSNYPNEIMRKCINIEINNN